MNVVPTQSGIIQVGEANMLGQLAQSGIVARSDGFFYTYVTNRSQGAVYFDNLSIKHWAPMVRVVYDYYPYGLTWENPKLPTDPNAVHDHAYQGKEFQFAEFTTGHGLALYDFHARMYDPCTARWLVPDPAAQFANPYLAMGNNPIAVVDPDGQLAFFVPVIIGAVAGGFIGGAIQQGDGGLSGANWNVGSWDNTAWQGITAGAIVGAGIGLAVSSGIAFAQGPISGISPGVSAGFSQFGTTTLGWDVTYNALMTANVNMASRALQYGGDWKNIAVSGLIGLAAGAIGGAAGASDKNFRNTMNLKGIRTQNYVTSILNGSGDRLYRSIDKGLNTSQIVTNTIMGGMEGFIMAWTLSSEGFGPKNSNTFKYVKTDLLKNVHVNARDVISHSFARYVSGFLSQVGTSIPGVGFQVGTAYLMAVGGLAMGTDIATTIAAGVFLWGGATTGASAVFDWTGLWDSYEEIGGFRPFTVGGRNFN